MEQELAQRLLEEQISQEVERLEQRKKFHNDLSQLTISSENDLKVDNPRLVKKIIMKNLADNIDFSMFCNAEEISISSDYVGELPDVSSLPKLKRMSVYSNCMWDEIAGLDLSKLESLYINLHSKTDYMALACPNLKSLTIYFPVTESVQSEGGKLDFTFLGNLQVLELHHAEGVDYKEIVTLRNLMELKINDNGLEKVDFLQEMHTLKKLTLHGKIVNVAPLADLTNLEYLNLCNNLIFDASCLKNLIELNFLDLYRNPVEIDFDRSEIAFSRVTENDKVIEDIKQRAEKTVDDAVSFCWTLQNKNIDDMPEWAKRREEQNRKLPFIDRVKKNQQNQFQIGFDEVLKLGTLSASDLSDFQKHDIYVRHALERYPYLEVTDDMKNLMENEQ
jgi:Leucine-rich repeat (LRR) protein